MIEENLSIELTTRCNSACSHCFARTGGTGPADLPGARVKEMLAEGYAAGYRHLHLTGGEPLLWAGLLDTIDHAATLGYRTVFLNTNGTLVTPAISARLAAVEGLRISISLDAGPALHDRMRGAGSWRRAISGTRMALDAGIETVIFTTVCNSALAAIPRFTAHIYDRFPRIRGIVLIQFIAVPHHDAALSADRLDADDFLRMVRMVSLLNLYGLGVHVLYAPLAHAAAVQLRMPWMHRSRARHRPGRLMIRANGDLAVSHSQRHIIGTYRPGMIRRVLSSEAYQKLTGPDRTTCPRCRFSKLCRDNGMIRPTRSPPCRLVLERASG